MNKILRVLSMACLALGLGACGDLPLIKQDSAAGSSRLLTKQSGTESVQLREARMLAETKDENLIFFDNGSLEINAEGRNKLSRHVARLKADEKLQLILLSQTGDQGSTSYNLAIAEKQADAVYKWLRAAGVPAGQLRRYPVGGEKLASPCVSEYCQQRMRRVELRYA
ncbi:MAG: OmpA family protein [Rhodocyclales bacterium]|nr:OmpA family protein [Rhodocyclales bacterium]